MHNIEFKAELLDPSLARTICQSLGATSVGVLEQTDTYYRLPSGRLKKRECPGQAPEWIFYDRQDRSRPKLSAFTIYTENQARARFGEGPMPVWIIVRKLRDLYMLGNVRIHLDRVEGLGEFLEFEALVSMDNSVAKCHAAVEDLRARLQPALGEPIACSYADLLAAEADEAMR